MIFSEYLMKIFQDLFHSDLSMLEKMIRPVIVYGFLVVVLRIFGKRELAQLNPFDLVVLLSLSNTVQNAIIGNDNSVLGGLVGAFTLLAVNYLVVRFLFKHRRLDELFEGSPTTLIDNGTIIEASLSKEMMTESELISVLHRQGFAGLDQVDRCVLEPGGIFFIQPKRPPQAETNHAEIMESLAQIRKRLDLLQDQSENR